MGQPLISDAQMLAMHAAMVQLRQAAPKRSAAAHPGAWPVSMLAATLLQLRSEDVLITAGELPLATATLRDAQRTSFHPALLPLTVACPPACAAAVAAGHALAQSRTERPGDHAALTLAMLDANTPYADALRLAGDHQLPLLMIVREEPGKPRAQVTSPSNVEIVPVDAEDAIAVCRVMQESTLRARNRWGAVMLRAVSLPQSTDPITALEAHLHRRNLAPVSLPDGTQSDSRRASLA